MLVKPCNAYQAIFSKEDVNHEVYYYYCSHQYCYFGLSKCFCKKINFILLSHINFVSVEMLNVCKFWTP